MISNAISTGLPSRWVRSDVSFGAHPQPPVETALRRLADMPGKTQSHPVVLALYKSPEIQARLQQVVRAFVRQEADREDILEQFWLKVAQYPHKFDMPDSARRLNRVGVAVTNIARDWWRQKKRKPAVSFEDLAKLAGKGHAGKPRQLDMATDGRYRTTESPDQILEQQEEVELGQAVLAKLGDKEQAILTRFADGENLQQIAAALGMSYGAARTLACRARQKLQTLLPEDYRKTG